MADVVLVAVIDGGGDLSEDPSSLLLFEAFLLAEKVVELSACSDFHHQDHLFFVLEN